ncbi:MAG: hypothetical protein WBD22_14455 [Pyrinomonadaceae bacterium]
MKLSPTEIFKGKKIFFIGGTGFVGEVTPSMLLQCWNADALVRNECEARTRTWSRYSFVEMKGLTPQASFADEGVRVPL